MIHEKEPENRLLKFCAKPWKTIAPKFGCQAIEET
jgi:hypothetical protein